MVILTGWKTTAATLNVSVATAKRLRIERGLPAINVSPRCVVLRTAALDAWLSRREPSTADAALASADALGDGAST